VTLVDVLYQAFRQNYHLDNANAAVHCAEVRYSPLTFRLAEEIHVHVLVSNDVMPDVYSVLLDRGAYPEDPGR